MADRRFTLCRRIVGLLALPVACYAMLRWFEYAQVFQPGRRFDAAPALLRRPWQEVRFPAADGPSLHAWFIRGEPGTRFGSLVFLVCHGNAGNISHRLELAEVLLSTGAGVLLFDYRGYGKSQGRPSEQGTYLDAAAAHDWLSAQGVAGSRIIVLGESLGGAVAAELALRRPVGGLVLQSTWLSVPALGADLFPWLPARWLATIRYDTQQKVAALTVPVLILHSRADSIIPYRHGETLHALASPPKWFHELEGDHNDGLGAERQSYLRALDPLLNEVVRRALGP
jgi:hypothetical protein